MLWQMSIVEHQKLFKRAVLWVEVSLLALVVIAINIIVFVVAQSLGSNENLRVEGASSILDFLTWPGALLQGLRLSAGPNAGGMLVIILVGAIFGQEYTWRTLSLWLSRGVSRPVLLGAKLLALVLPLLLIVMTPLLVGGALTAFFSYHLTGHIPYDQVNWIQLGVGILRTAFTLLPYLSLAFLLAVASRSTMVVIGVGLAYSLLVESIAGQLLGLVGGTFARIGQYLPAGLANSLMGQNASMVTITVDDATTVTQHVTPEAAAWGIALYTLFFLGLSILIFQRQDLAN